MDSSTPDPRWPRSPGRRRTPRRARWRPPSRACARYRFGADTPWFRRVVRDLGVLGVSPDLRSLAVLAATTTD
ncbi:DUF6183 family protein [Kitasatospora purpeofusca]|uniref:DUF6183 family protein n=1 Tax=Kitasatospora purpeofusca TaxID=67352 RepID=UPI0038178507